MQYRVLEGPAAGQTLLDSLTHSRLEVCLTWPPQKGSSYRSAAL